MTACVLFFKITINKIDLKIIQKPQSEFNKNGMDKKII